MDRREFLGKALGLTVVSAVTPGILTCACGAFAKEAPLAAWTTFTVDLSLATNAVLLTVNGSKRVSSPAILIITRVSETEFSVVDGSCTHEGFLLRPYNATSQLITCTAHTSTFDIYGNLVHNHVANQKSLKRYKATFDGDHILTVENIPFSSVEMELLSVMSIKNIFPNPFATTTTIDVTVAEGMDIDLSIFDLEGSRHATVFSGRLNSGEERFTFDGSALAAGSYFCRLTSTKGAVVRQIHIVR